MFYLDNQRRSTTNLKRKSPSGIVMLFALFSVFSGQFASSQITVTPGGSTTTIINNLVGAGITVSNVVINCGGAAYGTFSGNLQAGGASMANGGIVLTTGSAAGADGPNNSGSTSTSVAGFDFSDPNLTTQPGAGSPPPNFDNCVLEFDMVPTCATFNIAYVFGSEEYPEFVTGSFNDGFGMFITGPNPSGGNYNNFNFARLPNGQLVSIDNVNANANAGFYNTNTTGVMQYDGYTDGLTATVNVTPCQTYHIKIIIADAGDQAWDSGLFLGYQSFTCSVPPLVVTPSMTPATCGASNGAASVSTSGGVGPFTFLWSPGGQTTSSISNLAPGTYTVTVNDPLSCTPPQVVPITVTSTGAAPVLNPTVVNATCGCNGSINLNTTGGVAPYTFAWSGGLTGGSPTNVCPGTYTVTVTGANGCTATASATVTGPPALTTTASATPNLCNASCNGSATANPVGGLAPYTYNWSPGGQTGQTASNLCAGTYTVTVTAQGGCTATASVTVTQPNAITATATPTHVSCNGGTNGQIAISASGGTGTLQYSLNGGAFQSGSTFSGLGAGTYTIIVRDANGCQITITSTITQPTVLNASISSTVSSTCGQANGSVTIAASGGTTPYSFSLNSGTPQASGTFSNLVPGNYTVTVTDANGCTVPTPVTIIINALSVPTASITSQNNVSCAGGINGSVLVGISGGTAPFSYDLNPAVGPNPPAQASNSFTGLSAGNYTVVVSDVNGCSASTTFTITQPTQLSFTSVATPVLCNGDCNGQITITASNATPPYQYSSNGGATFQASNVLSNLCAGTINVVVRDANGCQVNANVVITQPAVLAATYTPTHPLCQGICNGSIAVATSSGGTAPYQFSVDGGALQSGTTFNGLCGGVHNMMIQDANGCQTPGTVILTDPPGYNVDTVFTDESNCGFNDGGFQVVASGGAAPYSYNNLTAGYADPTGTFVGLTAGAYEVLVTDANGCQETYFVGINDVQMSGVLNGLTHVTCPGACDGTVSTSATGGFGTITYDLDNGLANGFGSGDFTGLCGGSHAITMTDQGFCVFVVPFTINEPNPIIYTSATTNVSCNGGNNGTITFNTPSGGTAPYEYSIDGGSTFQSGLSFTGLTAGSYNLVVRDANGCTQTSTANITQPSLIVVSENHTDLTCNGNNTGTLSIGAVGGVQPYEFSNDNCVTFQNFSSFFALAAGTYDICVRDANGCIQSSTATITEPDAISATSTPDDPDCFDGTDGSISISASGGTPVYQYSSDNGVTFQPGSAFTGLTDGTYSIQVKDANGCTFNLSETLSEPTQVSFTNSSDNTTCGGANGSVTVIASGGTGAYQFSSDNGATFQASGNFTGLNANTYTIIVEDANGCQATDTAIVVDEGSPVINGVIATDPLCFGSADGTAEILYSGGTAPLLFSVNGGATQSSSTLTGLTAGNHVAQVEDANGCLHTFNFTLNEPAVLGLSSNIVNLTCFNDFSGSFTIVASGGTAPYQYSFDGGATYTASPSNNFIPAGTYNLEVLDNNNCSVTGTAIVTQPDELVFQNFTTVNASCFGVCDGQVQAFPAGGTVSGLYNFNWSNSLAGPAQATATNICDGTYSVIITDDNGCTIDTTFTITEPAEVVINSTLVTDVLCNAACDGTITINSNQATNYSIDGGVTFVASNAFTNVCAGTYSIIVEDAAGCSADTTIIVHEPALLDIFPPTGGFSCAGGDFNLTALGIGGTPPFTYTWTGTTSTSSSVYVNQSITTTYDVFATDANGCVSPTASATVEVYPLYTATVSADTTICPGASVTLSAQGSLGLPGYYYQWSSGDTSQTTTVTPLVPTSYEVMTFDVCQDTLVLTVNVNFHTPPAVNFVASPASGCEPFTTTLINTTPVGQIGGNCLWDLGALGTYSNCVSVTQTFNNPGCYDVSLTVTSPEGCISDTTIVDAVCVHPNPVADFNFTPLQPTVLSPGVNFSNQSTGATTYIWAFDSLGTSTDENPTFIFPGGFPGNYEVCLTAVSQFGCTDDTCKIVTIYDELLIYVPNAFTPDGDGINDVFLPIVNGVDPDPNKYDFMIFNRWGELIHEGHSPTLGWDGTHRGKEAKQDVYVWKIKLIDQLSGEQKVLYGHVSLLR